MKSQDGSGMLWRTIVLMLFDVYDLYTDVGKV